MNAVCLYFQVHQPWRLRKDFNFFKIGVGHGHGYDDDKANADRAREVARKCYIPANKLMLELIKRHPGEFKISFSITGTALDQFELYCPEVLESFKALVATGAVEMIGETYYHSLAFLYSREEFREQVNLHREKIQSVFGVTPTTFRNTELIYSNDLAQEVEALGFKAILTEGADKILGWRSPNFVYMPKPCEKLHLLLRNDHLSDDLAFRFGDPSWAEQPLTANKYASWIHKIAGGSEIVNLFMNYKIFGAYHTEPSGIFNLLAQLPAEILRHPDFQFMTPGEVARDFRPVARLDVPQNISWAETEGTSAWLGNPLQDAAAEQVYSLERAVKASHDDLLIAQWRRLLTSDHFYYMGSQWHAESSAHKANNPYTSPYDAFMVYSNILTDLTERLKEMKLLDAAA